MSLSDYIERKDNSRMESEPMEIFHESEIKISESILKIEIMNN